MHAEECIEFRENKKVRKWLHLYSVNEFYAQLRIPHIAIFQHNL